MRIVFGHIDDGPRPLAADELHVWTMPLERPCNPDFLTGTERDRASRFKMDRIRLQFIAARAQLRVVLGRYLDDHPAAVPITYEPSGKPVLDPRRGVSLHFNLSHSESVGVVAVSCMGPVGVDVERRRVIPNAESLVERFFTPRERELFIHLPAEHRLAAFFRAWTRKEAVLKAVGLGVQSLDQCDVTFGPDEPEAVLRLGDDDAATGKWFLRSWQPVPEFDAAVALGPCA